ncbi:nucleotide pyrophosphohydrolase [Clostridium tetani]|uniref:nucleoside triphosphate pyrophosphohydrolase family protein n=1 Tax=Clostridium tetani TaxID=1513 RepID=UPI0005738D49|nr:nucleoside triphosphate pyrophosphohydrolase family protein [Clostridium tetani]KHO39095.1 nucleotide pyrophosphohydrolase [Clostridium tetani]
MNFKEYQDKALRTKLDYSDNIDQLINGVMGLNGESGEVIDLVKKFLYQGHDYDTDKIIEELGDVLWYIVLTANSLDINLEEVAKHNINKLEKRYPNGYFKVEHSVNRVEE